MGRGRAKAKQTKVARELKYSSPETDYAALQRELGHPSSPLSAPTSTPAAVEDDDEDDRWASGDR